MNHTPTPWKFTEADDTVAHIGNDSGQLLAACYSQRDGDHRANALHIAACVNSCDGINPAAVPLLLDALKTARSLLEDVGYTYNGEDGAAMRQIDNAIAEAGVEACPTCKGHGIRSLATDDDTCPACGKTREETKP